MKRKIFLVTAHPDSQSFNHRLSAHAEQVLGDWGHEVKRSNLYQEHFDPVAKRSDFTTTKSADYFNYQEEQKQAGMEKGFAPYIQQEIDKLLWCDRLIIQFPLWWFGPPAILKGWFDKVLAYNLIYGGQKGIFKKAGLQGKRAILSLTTGGPEIAYGSEARNGDLNTLLFPIQHGTLYFCGMDVLPPFVVWNSPRLETEEKELYLKVYEHRLKMMDKTPAIKFHH